MIDGDAEEEADVNLNFAFEGREGVVIVAVVVVNNWGGGPEYSPGGQQE